jgi:hypothetical protein
LARWRSVMFVTPACGFPKVAVASGPFWGRPRAAFFVFWCWKGGIKVVRVEWRAHFVLHWPRWDLGSALDLVVKWDLVEMLTSLIRGIERDFALNSAVRVVRAGWVPSPSGFGSFSSPTPHLRAGLMNAAAEAAGVRRFTPHPRSRIQFSRTGQRIIGAWRTRPWPVSGWGCWGRRLSRG